MKRRTLRLAGALAATGLTLGLTLAATGTARADIPPPTSWAEIYTPYLNAQGITLCADDTNGSTAPHNPAQLYHCHGYDSKGAPQRWGFVPFDPGTISEDGHTVYHLYNYGAGECLIENAPGQQLDLNSCDLLGAGWELITAPGTNGPDFQLRQWDSAAAGSPECAAASNYTGNNNTRLVMEPCSATDTRQLFRLG
jgi:hypothetical protein